IVAPIGAGGMGDVWRALQEPLGREVALKLIRREKSGDDDARARFEREARVMSALSNAHIAALHDFGVDDDGTLFIALELLRGETLRARIRRVGSLSASSAVAIA